MTVSVVPADVVDLVATVATVMAGIGDAIWVMRRKAVLPVNLLQASAVDSAEVVVLRLLEGSS